MQSSTFKNINENVYHFSQKIEGYCLRAWPIIGIPCLALGAGAFYYLQGKVVSILTAGKFTTLNAALLSSPYVVPLYLTAAKITFVGSLLYLSILFCAVASKCISAKLLGKEISWDNWDFVLKELHIT